MAEGNSNASNVRPITGPAPEQYISQKRILEYKSLEAQLKILKERLEKECDDLVEALIDPHCQQEQGPLYLELGITKRRSPKWKEEFINVAGKEAAEAITENTDPTVIRKPIVKFR